MQTGMNDDCTQIRQRKRPRSTPRGRSSDLYRVVRGYPPLSVASQKKKKECIWTVIRRARSSNADPQSKKSAFPVHFPLPPLFDLKDGVRHWAPDAMIQTLPTSNIATSKPTERQTAVQPTQQTKGTNGEIPSSHLRPMSCRKNEFISGCVVPLEASLAAFRFP